MNVYTKDSPVDFRPTLADRAAWERRAAFLRDQVRLATGQPFARPPVRATVTGTTEHDGYRVSNVCFASAPGLYVTGNLYRPTKPQATKSPAVLHHYGHWPDGRFQQTSDEKIDAAIAGGSELLRSSAKSPLQAANVQFARMGCVAFQFDMVGYADDKPLPHMLGFDDAKAIQRGQSAMMLQTINSLAALDFLASLDDVDASRIAVGGASSGGTQTLMLGILDDRPAAFFIAGMIGMAMQGGCPCEQSPGLRVDTNNVELAGLLAPRPLFCSGASGDWTRGFAERGLPELKTIYSLFDAREKVDGAVLPWPHNFNAHTRRAFYEFVTRTFALEADIVEREFDVLTPKQLSVFDEANFPPVDAADLETIRAAIRPKVDATLALRTLLDLDGTARATNAAVATPSSPRVTQAATQSAITPNFAALAKGATQAAATRVPEEPLLDIEEGAGDPLEFVVRWRNTPDPLAASRLDGKPDWFPLVFNRPPILRAARELIELARSKKVSSMAIRADRGASPAALVACAAEPKLFATACLELGDFDFDQVTSFDDPRLLPHALAMGGVEGLRKAAGATKLFDESAARPADAGLVSLDFLYESAPFPSCHSATLVETEAGSLLASFFGGTHERHPDVCIYVCRKTADGWTPPESVADGGQPDGKRLPTWNPVLFQPRGGPVMLFYKVGPNPRDWWGMLKTSDDDGRTWGAAQRLPDGLLGPIKNKPVQLADGTIISPTSVEISQDANDDGARAAGIKVVATEGGWFVYFEISEDGGKTFRKTARVPAPKEIKAIQPSLLVHPNGRLQAIGRTQANRRLFTCWSEDNGRTWGPMSLLDLPNCNSGTDAVTLRDGRHALIYNHSDTAKIRYPLNVAISDDGVRWDAAVAVETQPPGQYSYPSIIQTRDGMLHVIYTWKRQRIRHGVIDPTKIVPRPIVDGAWPA